MATAKKVTKQKDKQVLSSYEDACKALNREPLTLEDFSSKLPADKRQYLLSVERVTTFIEALKEGHEFDWNNRNDRKYFPWWDMETYGDDTPGSGFSLCAVDYVRTPTIVCARLSSKTDAHARLAAQVMLEDYRIIMKK